RKLIAAATQGFDRLDRIVRVELATQAADEDFDRVAVAIEVLRIQPLGQLRLGDDLAGAMHEVLEDAVLEAREVDLAIVDRDFLRARIERNGTTSQDRLRPPARTAQQRLYARQQFLEVKGLGDIVVRARLQAFDFVLPAIARGQDQDRIGLALRAQLLDEVEARQLGQ